MNLLLILIGLIALLIGIFLLFGGGWVVVLFDFFSAITGNSTQPSGNYSKIQKKYSTKNPILKLFGLLLIFASIIVVVSGF